LRTDSRPPFARILVANRGEIAVRIIRACRELGIQPIAIHSDVDRDAVHVRTADHSELIGPASPAESYLSIDAVISAARRSGADAIHPGYGFLSENAAFARAVTDAGMVFIGPPASAIEALGNKLAARVAAADAGVPIVPGTSVALGDDIAAVEALGFPVMLKAAAGGGGRGMRRVDEPGQVADAIASASREALSAFGDGTIYVERLVEPARHVEVQLLGDRHGNLAVLGERDCSIQRRHQKLVEESPAPGISEATRDAMLESARLVATTVEFHNAATAEFLLGPDGRHYFLEMNTRLQVEHGVTELVTGLDLVAWQIRVAAGEALPPAVLQAPRSGHAIEVRIYAEDPYHGFGPTAGRIGAWRMPDGPGIRVDTATEAGMPLPAEYDPLLAKLMVHAEDRPAAVDRLRRALDETVIGGLQTDAGFLTWLARSAPFVDGAYDTGFIARHWVDGPELTPDEHAAAAAAALEARRSNASAGSWAAVPEPGSAWGAAARRDALRR
jgi:acetyl/propionyl-CoA carboxylase alpha subunit